MEQRTATSEPAQPGGRKLLFRIVQGLGGGGMVPVAQSILADSSPEQSRPR